MSELTERLREGMIWVSERHEFDEARTNALMDEAADELDAQEARINELEKALRPFAEHPDEWTIYTVEAAIKALSQKPNKSKTQALS